MVDKYLNTFIFELNNERQIYDTSFSQLYDFGITAYTESLKIEISDNFLKLDKMLYLLYVEDKIKSLPCTSISVSLIDKWINKFKISNSNFPYYDSKELTSLLKTYVNSFYIGLNDNDEIIDREELISLQIDFYLYASMLETKKILKFIDSIRVNVPIVKENLPEGIVENKEILRDEVTYHRIFKSIKSANLFVALMEYLDISKNDINKRGVQAKFNGIWTCPASRDKIFRHSALQNEYVDYLNSEFLTSYIGRSMSDGSFHHRTIKEFMLSFSIS